MIEILQQKMVKRGIPLKNLDYGKVEPATGSSVRQKITLQQGIPSEKAKDIVRLIKDSKKKVQATIQGDTVRIVETRPLSKNKRWRVEEIVASGVGEAAHS